MTNLCSDHVWAGEGDCPGCERAFAGLIPPALPGSSSSSSSIDATLAERGARYGDFTDHAAICQGIKRLMMATPGWARLNDVQKQALDVIADKQARILSGDPNYADNWHDIQGYAKLAEDRLPKE